jgi:hypothetical protein
LDAIPSGVVAWIKMELELPHRSRFQDAIAFDTGSPTSNIRLRTVQADQLLDAALVRNSSRSGTREGRFKIPALRQR